MLEGTLAGLQPKFVPSGTPLITGGVVFAVQVLVTYAVAVFPQPSVATTVKSCVTKQPLVVITLVWLIAAVPQALLALSPAMLEGTLAGLQPKFVPIGTPLMTGGVVLAVQVLVT
jgi:hypothetical protein